MLAAPINPSDINQVEGVYPIKKKPQEYVDADSGEKLMGYIGGNEGVAQVVKIDSAIKDEIKVGDWVAPRYPGSLGTWSEYAYADVEDLVRIRPAETNEIDNKSESSTIASAKTAKMITPEDLSTVKVNGSTAYRMLSDFMQAKKDGKQEDQYVIQNGANGSAGQYVIQIAKELGLKTINVVRDRENFEETKAQLCKLGADIVIKDSELVAGNKSPSDTYLQVLALSKKGLIKLGINCVGGGIKNKTGSIEMAKMLANKSYYVTYGAMSKLPLVIPASFLIFKDIRFVGFWVSQWYVEQPVPKWQEMWQDLGRMIAENKLKPQPMNPIAWPTVSTTANTSSSPQTENTKQSIMGILFPTSVDGTKKTTAKNYFKFY
ncbi:putative trans-2-enoyl-CoA reductase 1, mitochondrial [Zancudomyces culisetae]|uniref:Putative trans-2-enoyl-CoA reductase 1, mitochondrial n=1 Tax=Zancudomyces culisetae TaxID=1213189 RepID=A0A1R1PM25_ZANCU|nr:putative trans-2-enoyl-CoA reductase 1, mitochondrial [Zancudomyces culisetae]|eukprot:OMH82006.1 putative trans-2-enoyl-CoA reductase 1, mitochondrial [Zancudomyces culisetae]